MKKMANSFIEKYIKLVLDSGSNFLLNADAFESCLVVLSLLKASLELKKKNAVLPLHLYISKANGWAKTKYVFRFTMYGREAAGSKHTHGREERRARIKGRKIASKMHPECFLFSSKRTKEHQRAYRNVFQVLLGRRAGRCIPVKSFVKS